MCTRKYHEVQHLHAHQSHLEQGVILDKNINGTSHMEADQSHTGFEHKTHYISSQYFNNCTVLKLKVLR